MSFEIELFELGTPILCLYAWCCPLCAIARSRQRMDGSPICFNICCISTSLAPFRWIVRSAYGIGGKDEFLEDCMLSTFCYCCVVNQLYQTVIAVGNPTNDGGHKFNRSEMKRVDMDGVLCRSCCAFCCSSCTVGTMLNMSIGMPFLLGCSCVNFYAARNLIRYQYRLKPSLRSSDEIEECLTPCYLYTCAGIMGNLAPCIWFALCVGLVYCNVKLQKEVELRCAEQSGNGYLVGYGNGSILPEAAAEVQDDDLSALKNEYEDTSDSQIELTNV